MHHRILGISRRLTVLAILLVLAAVLAACGNQEGNQTSKTKAYDDDGYLGLTSSNPNLQTSPSYHTYATDTAMIRKAALSVKGVRDLRVVWGTGRAHVTLQLEENVSPDERRRIQQEALQAITHNMPRYPVDVSLD